MITYETKRREYSTSLLYYALLVSCTHVDSSREFCVIYLPANSVSDLDVTSQRPPEIDPKDAPLHQEISVKNRDI